MSIVTRTLLHYSTLTTLIVSSTGLAGKGSMPSALQECPYVATDSSTIDASGIDTVRVLAGPGDLRVKGATRSSIQVVAHRCASSQEMLTRLTVDVQRDDATLIVRVHVPRDLFSTTQGTTATANLMLDVPRTVAVRAEGLSGDAEVDDIATLSLNSNLGDVNLQKIAGAIVVHAGPGDIQVTNSHGPVSIEQRVGSIVVRGIEGDVSVARAHTGPIELRDVKGDIRIASLGRQSGKKPE